MGNESLPQWLGEYMPEDEELCEAMVPDYVVKGGNWSPPNWQSDLLRLYLLWCHGGVWVDATMLCRRPLDHWLGTSAASGFFAFSPEGSVEVPEGTAYLPIVSSFIAAAPAHPIVTAWLDCSIQHWLQPSRQVLGYFWLHRLFKQVIDSEDPETFKARDAWEQVPRVTGEYGA